MTCPRMIALLLATVAALGVGRSSARAEAVYVNGRGGPSAPTDLVATASGSVGLSLRWAPSSAGRNALAGYHVYRDGASAGTTRVTSFPLAALSCGTTFAIAVDAYDVRGRTSARARAVGRTADCPPLPPPSPAVWKPVPGTSWQWQITGAVDESVPARMFDLDLFDARAGQVNAGVIGRLHAKGVVVICYLDSGAYESYRPDAAQFPAAVIGNSTGWSGERWLDIRAQAWPAFASIIWARLDLARSLGCDGVEPDQNNPVGNDPGFPITYADEKAWYLEVARQAHLRGLSVGMKNGIEVVDPDLVAAFDWALNEECFQYDECNAMKPFIAAGKAVFQTEYTGDPAVFCPKALTLGFSTIQKHLSLDAWRITCS